LGAPGDVPHRRVEPDLEPPRGARRGGRDSSRRRLLMLAQEVIRRKRDGETLAPEEIRFLIEGLITGRVSECQAAACAMAICLRGMVLSERVALTEAMRDSGNVLRWDLPGPVVDKHSTGGIGDNVSLMLAPALAACATYV